MCSAFQSNVLCLSEFLSSGLSVNSVFARLRRFLVRWCFELIKLFSCLNVFGGGILRIASVFPSSGFVPSRFNL